ncbi:hypothetical protein K469DRAFT_711737 [Zopfia rhizophila CBS 207.26]|uniref:RING-type domain-containing protein n=1 Tax=Zopfia rhizophila CBS 207.26 TaxID=1314779 RepID=A0A6A6DSI7_9PEZI|nr:hypothetical protein K469DRAFT_711737 [Zopfia rhizophila CBS 207.26]
MANDTDYEIGGSNDNNKDNRSAAIAIVLPALFAIIIIILLAIAFLLPRITGNDSPESKEERKKKRLARLNKTIKVQHFVDWANKQRDEHPEAPITVHPICVICLDEIEDAAQIRGLGCLHVFHQECLDDWFARWNEYCPLCHRPIIQAMKNAKKHVRDEQSQLPPVAMMV